MKLAEITSFRKDLLFHGAVQLGWFERNKSLSDKAAAHFIFHGPDYHGVRADDFAEPGLQLVDTASFTREITERLTGKITDEPFVLAIAGYGTGKSHLALTLATLFSRPKSEIAQKILKNLTLADEKIGRQVASSISSLSDQPFLVVTLNGMEDFDLGSEISRQLLSALKDRGIDTKVLENLRPRFKLAENFAASFHLSLKEDFQQYFGPDYQIEDIIKGLEAQDEKVFQKVNEIYAQKMGSALPAAGQESLQDFIRVTKEAFCGPGKPFAGILLLFDEFGRYLEFAVQKPHIAGPAALQQLFEAVQENGDRVFLLAFIQNELKAYASRVAPERREEINRYLTRFDAVRKVRLSTNLETVIANLLEKKNPQVITEHLSGLDVPLDHVQSCMMDWFPEIRNHSLWLESEGFNRIIGQGCWPLHPLSTWVLYKLTTIGKSLQQRSALSLLADVFEIFQNRELKFGQTIRPTDLLTEGLVDEFSASESFGAQGAVTYAYQSVLQKYQYELSPIEKSILKAIVLQQKIGIKVKAKDDYIQAMSMFCGISTDDAEAGVNLLEKEYGVLEWNGLLCQYEIVGDAVPRKSFLAKLMRKTEEIGSERRAQIFNASCKHWLEKEEYNTDFGVKNDIVTKEWNYNVYFTNAFLLENQIQFALRAWRDAKNVDNNKGQLIYCYVGPESNLDLLQHRATEMIKSQMQQLNLDWNKGAPLAILFLYDSEGKFGQKLAEYWVLEQGFSDEEKRKFANFILDKKNSTKQELELQFSEMEKERNAVFAIEKKLDQGRLKEMLEQLFDVVYPNRIPFHFDGFNTIRGNAAKDSQVFTKELLLGNLDRDWLQARSQQQRNRGYTVLDKSWGIFDDDGSVRLLPANAKVREALKVLDNMLQAEDETESKSVNLGEVVRLWMAPPFGCNLAVAGLLLAIYIGRRQEELELLVNNDVITIEKWLAKAMPSNFFDLSVLNDTEIVRVSKDKVSEWDALLEEWQLEPTHIGKIQYREKANQLQNRISVPQKLKFKYELLQERTKKAVQEQRRLESALNDALERIESGNAKDDVSLISWGAAILAEEYHRMMYSKECWTKEQLKEIEKHYTFARLKVKRLFPQWLNSQRVTSIEQLGKFKHHMNVNIGRNLEQIGLNDEKRMLEAHVEEVEKNVRLLAEIKESTEEVRKLIERNTVSETSTVTELLEWLEQAKTLKTNLQEARGKTNIAKHEISEAAIRLEQFSQACRKQIQQHKSKAVSIYNHRQITCLADITKWKSEVTELTRVFAGKEKDIEDFRQVIKQLEQLENQYSQLNDDSLTEEELDETLERCRRELDDLYPEDQPPLDSEPIYNDMMKNIRQRRCQLASEWMERMLQKTEEIQTADATRVLEIKRQLEKMPAVLSGEQRQRIEGEIEACERRLDELEVEGLLAKFDAFSENNKTAFLKKLIEYLEKHFPKSELRIPFKANM